MEHVPVRRDHGAVNGGRAHPYDDGAVELPDGRLLGYAQYGDPEGDAILWFHGTPGARLQVPPEIDREGRRRGFRVITVERPGNGQSTPHLYRRIKHVAPDIAAFADALGIDRFGLVGLSGGGPYVLGCAHELPDRVAAAAVLGGIGPTQGPEKAPGYTGLLALVEHLLLAARGAAAWGFSHALRSLRPVADQGLWLYMRLGPSSDRPVFERPEMAEMFKADILGGLEVGMKGPIYDLALFARHWGFALRDITVPIRFWQGDADLIVPVEHGAHQAGLVQDGLLFVRPGEGHFAGFTAIAHVLDELDAAWPDRRRRPRPETPIVEQTS
jgi:pimeloyl-ACP methyl ester carboxylesterase